MSLCSVVAEGVLVSEGALVADVSAAGGLEVVLALEPLVDWSLEAVLDEPVDVLLSAVTGELVDAGSVEAGSVSEAFGVEARAELREERVETLLATFFGGAGAFFVSGAGLVFSAGSETSAAGGGVAMSVELVLATFVGAGAGMATFVVDCAVVACVDPVSWLSQKAPPMTTTAMVPIAVPKWFTESSFGK